MESYLQFTEAYLGMIQTTLSDEELKRSSKAGEEIFDAIAEITDKYNLTIKEMLNASVGVHYSIMQSTDDQLQEYKEKEAKAYE